VVELVVEVAVVLGDVVVVVDETEEEDSVAINDAVLY